MRQIGIAAVLLVAVSIISFSNAAPSQQQRARRIETVSLDPVAHIISWRYSVGTYKDGVYEIESLTTLEVNLDKGTMNDGRHEAKITPQFHDDASDILEAMASLAAIWTDGWDAVPTPQTIAEK